MVLTDPGSMSSPLLRTWSQLKNVIVVCGHAVFTGGSNSQVRSKAANDSNWILQTFQKGEGEMYISHVKAGVQLASEDPSSLLIFSGGQTRSGCTLSEGQGYHDLAEVFDFWGYQDVRLRTTTEEFSRDSFDNVLFGIARFFECVRSLPQRLTIVSWGFKKARFEHHALSIHWQMSAFTFIGVGDPEDLQTAERAEEKTLYLFRKDPFGYATMDDVSVDLGAKKAARNPFRRQHGYTISCPSMTRVLQWRGPGGIPASHVPWPSS